MRQVLVIIEKSGANYSAYSPDLPGCGATGNKTRQDAVRVMCEAMRMHVEGMREDGDPVPEPHSSAEYIAVPIP